MMSEGSLRNFSAIGTLGDLARHHALVRPDSEGFWFEGQGTTYGAFDRLTNQIANGLRAEGLTNGSRVAFMDKNSDAFYQIVFGAAKANTVSVGINWRLAPPEVAYILNDSRAEILFVGPDFFALAAGILSTVPTLRRVVAMSPGYPEWTEFTRWRDQFPDSDPGIPVSTEDVAIQMYTSGTTGHPKGVQLQQRCFFDLWRNPPAPDMAFNDWTERDVNYVAMPSFHIGGVGWGILGIRPGARNIIVREFDPGATLEMISRFGVTKLFLVPSAIRMLLQHPAARGTDFSSVRYIHYGASPIPLDLLREAIEVFGCGFAQLYGMTETTGSATYLPPEDHDLNGNPRMRSAGKPFPGVVIKVVDEAGQSVPVGTVGEICIKSPVNMLGYWNLPDATAKTLIDGYVHTGDAGYLDDAGYVYVHDRVKDMIVSGAENVYPAEVESALFGHPAVADVAVFGVPDERWGEAVKAAVVLKPGHVASADDILGFARERIASYKLPKSIDFIAELPRNPSGKILKRELRKPYWEGMSRNVN
jgi:long-chain acyl-CoA synthetase